ncbi:T9SS type A sorting domain-containing protein [Aequorivita sp. SDUM287046]|uniref:T9SS type A sorting domain-containing protein n=1 Tax=Aequorivita aurantiaca TaxID=3053356 RepID=A0ABT8DH78_9FLAO|nr:T9SS type A sorting domain-containing protein [Aequorivita aurantiaca]MDN3723250.1 T9SS type A sorting domain-containing protein [Aequorivita aurantiaca]
MKNVITFLMCSLCIIAGIAQSDETGNALIVPERTPELNVLYQQAKALEETGTAAQINANILAIKNAWQEIDPNVAALYNPIVTNKLPETVENFPINGVYTPSEILERDGPGIIPEWGTDQLLRNDYIDGIDMDAGRSSKDIYIAAYENIIDFGGTFDSIFIHRSQDGGLTFQEWQKVGVTAPMRKLQLITYDEAGGDNYLIAYLVTATENLQAWRWNMANGAFTAEVIASDVIDFEVDTNYPGSTGSQRSFATYRKNTNTIYSARSTSGDYGFNWADETSLGIVGEQVAFSYGYVGSCYTAFIGFNSRSLRANVSDSNNDPASWTSNETITDGALIESLNPTIRSTRKSLPSDEVVIITSSRPEGSSDSYTGQAYLRENEAAYTPLNYITAGADASVSHIESWMQKVNNSEKIETAYVRDDIDNSENDLNRSHQYDGTAFGPFEGVGDSGLDVFDGFPSAVAETSDENPCMAFAGSSGGGIFGFGLYFDAQNSTASVDENSFDGFKFYPNPAQEVLNLSAKNNIEHVSIYSILGQMVLETSPQHNEAIIQVASLTPGVYVLKLAINGQSATHKFIKQ